MQYLLFLILYYILYLAGILLIEGQNWTQEDYKVNEEVQGRARRWAGASGSSH